MTYLYVYGSVFYVGMQAAVLIKNTLQIVVYEKLSCLYGIYWSAMLPTEQLLDKLRLKLGELPFLL